METKNDILAALINETRLKTNSSILPLATSDLAIIKRELEDDKLLEELERINSSPLAYNPFGVELLLSDTSELLKSCIEKRTELKNLEVILLNDSINKILSEQKRKYEKEIDAVEKKYPDTAKILAKQIKLKTSPTSVEADDLSVNEIRKYEEEIEDLTDKLKKQCEYYEDLLQDFSNDKNSGLNYLARYMELKEIYWEDFKEVFRKLKSLEVGFKTVYDIDIELPKISEDNLLNKYYIWLKANLLKLNKLLETEQEFTLTISLRNGIPVSGKFPEGGWTADVALKPEKTDWGTLLESCMFDFSLSAYSKGRLRDKKFKIRNIAATILLDEYREGEMKTPEYWQISIKPPDQKDSLGNNYSLPYLNFNCCNSKEEPSGDQVKSSTYFNSDPYAGWWSIKNSYNGTQHNQISRYGSATRPIIIDILIFLRVSVIL